MEQHFALYEDEIMRVAALLDDRCWINWTQQGAEGELIVSTADGQVWKIGSALQYARLLYLYECDDR